MKQQQGDSKKEYSAPTITVHGKIEDITDFNQENGGWFSGSSGPFNAGPQGS